MRIDWQPNPNKSIVAKRKKHMITGELRNKVDKNLGSILDRRYHKSTGSDRAVYISALHKAAG